VPARRLQRRWTVVPEALRGKVSEYAKSKTGRYQPIVDSAKLILHGGPLALAAYVLAYLALAWLDEAGSFYGPSNYHGYLLRGMAWLVGPHDWGFWTSSTPMLGLISQLIIVPLRIALIATVFGYCWLHATRAQQIKQDAALELDPEHDGVTCVDDINRGGGHVAGQQEVELHGTGLATELGGAGNQRVDDARGRLVPPAPTPIGEEPGTHLGGRGPRPLDDDDS
jgi:hypothetical protein